LPEPNKAVAKTYPVAPPPVSAAPESKPEPAPAPKPVLKTETPPAPKAAPKTEPVATAPGNGHFSIQVASVQELEGAEKLVTDLRKKGYQAYQIRSEVAGKGVWYRIRVGAFENRGAAQTMLAKLKGDKFGGMVVNTK
jgi:cell division septation protein DedD